MSKFLAVTWYVFAMFCSLCYSAVLLSFLTVPLEDDPIRDFKELSDAVAENAAEVYAGKGSFIHQTLLTADQDYLKLIGDAIARNSWYAIADETKLDVKKHILGGKNAYLSSRINLLKIFGFWRDIFISKDSCFHTSIAVAINKQFCCKEDINNVIVRLVDGGFFNKFVEDDSFKSQFLSTEEVTKQDDQIKPLTLKDLSGPFVLLIGGLFLASLVLILETFFFKYN